LPVWNNGLTVIPIDEAVRKTISLVEKELEENSKAIIGLSGHSLGGTIALIAAFYLDIDFLILEDAAIGGAPDWVLKIGGFDLANPAVISGLRKNCAAVKHIQKILANTSDLPPILELRGWFAIGGQFLFGTFPLTGCGKVIRFPQSNHHLIWQHPRSIEAIAQFAQLISPR